MNTEIVAKTDQELTSTEGSFGVPAIIARVGQRAGLRFLEFFAATIRNTNTRRAYYRGCTDFFKWCQARELELERIAPMHVAAYIERLTKTHSKPTVKLRL